MKIFEGNPQIRLIFIFGFAVAALLMLIFAFMVDMPLRAILIAVAFSNIIFLGLITLGDKLPKKRP